MRKAFRSALVLLFAAGVLSVRAEVILQYFNTSWKELADKMPELAEAGYGSLWLAPPTKGSGGLSVGYDLWDSFDLGGKDQRGSVKTRYGTEEELLRLIRTAHRFGIRVYFDNIMNHRAFDVPGYNENTPIDTYPGLVPEDFHLRVTEDGFYRKWDNVANWGDVWQVQNRNFSDLIDIAHENPNANFGRTEGSTFPKISFVRQAALPQFYDYMPTPTGGSVRVGFYSTNITTGLINSNESFYSEDVGGFLIRAVRWLMDYTKVDGLRLDAVKHVPAYFYGAFGNDTSSDGYCGAAQWQYNITRGFSDWNNHRDTVFDTDKPRDDAMMFGEHLGSPPGYGEYTSVGMRLVDATLKNRLNNILGNPSSGLQGLDQAGASGDPAFNQFTGVMFAKSHDDDYATRTELHYGFYLTRQGFPNIYTDGNYQSETLAQSGGAFPRHANTAFLGQFGDNRIPNLVYIHNHFAHGDQIAKWADNDVVAYERRDKRENTGMSDEDGTVLLFMMNDNYASGAGRSIDPTFGDTPFVNDAYLYNYSTYGGGFYVYASQIKNGSVIIPPGGYFAFSWRTPEESDLWKGFGGAPVTIYENGQQVGSVSYVRKDGPNGDPGFNPYGAADSNSTDYSYTWSVPRVTSPTNLRFVARVDGSAKNVLIKLDGGVDINSHMPVDKGDTNEVYKRDNPPGIFPLKGSDLFLGYEQATYKHRQHREKFAARNTDSNNVIGSAGAETYICTIGSTGFTVNAGVTNRDSDAETAQWVYHDPVMNISASNNPVQLQFTPPPQSAGGTNVTVWVKVGYGCDIGAGAVYYTTDGASFPEGAGSEGFASTRVAPLTYVASDTSAANIDWWKATLPALSNGAVLRYKIGLYRVQGGGCGAPFDVPFPTTGAQVTKKKSMMGVWEITNFNAGAAVYAPHIDYAAAVTGLVEGFHVLRARAYLDRDNRAALFNTFVQPFYYDAMAPTGQVIYPATNFTPLLSQEYGVVVRTDPTVRDAYYNIKDNNPANDDANTGKLNGNGLNSNGVPSWIRAFSEVPSLDIVSPYPDQWRFTYRNIPASGTATIEVKLAEISSSTNLQLSDAQGRFTTLQRLATCAAPTQQLFVRFPENDNEPINDQWDYIAKAWFSPSMDSNVTNFLVRINGSAIAQSSLAINFGVDSGNFNELAFTLPDLFNGDSNFVHTIQVVYTSNGGVQYQATRFIRAYSTGAGVYVSILSPPEVDGDGQPFRIVLPDVAAPTPEQRQYPIVVETDLSASNTWIEFANNAGSAPLLASTEAPVAGLVSVANASATVAASEKAMAGTVSATLSNSTITGSGSLFSNDLAVGYTIRIDTNWLTVTQIVSQTQLDVAGFYPGVTTSGAPAFVVPRFDVDFITGAQIKIASNILTVSVVSSSSNLTLAAPYPGASQTNVTAYRIDPNPKQSGTRKRWNYLWTNIASPGAYTFFARVDTNGVTNTVDASATRNTTVIFKQIVPTNLYDFDSDDDGLYDYNETTPTNHPSAYQPNSELWNNGQIHIWQVFGKTDPYSPDTDGDGLPDGLESGWRTVNTNDTQSRDTNGDGWPNFIADLDPPFYNTLDNYGSVPGVNSQTEGGDRSKLVQGTMTDPNNPDSDYDGIPDGVEDRNRNGWVDGDGSALGPTNAAGSRASWPTRQWTPAWTETDPNNNDTDKDGASDGYGEDKDFNGRIAGDVNSNRVWEAGELWLETNPLNPDTDGDGLPDGWEVQFGLDPWDSGVVGNTNLRTGLLISNILNGAFGNPDGDVVCSTTNAYYNLLEFQNGTSPTISNSCAPPPEGSIVIGRGTNILGVLNGVTNYTEFTDWTWDDLIVLDEYEGDGGNNQGGDVYLRWDGWDSSRDIVAFYARDGGSESGEFYFRVDLHDLQPLAEEGNLDLYVMIDFNSRNAGEMALPDDVDLITSSKWEVVVAAYQSGQGRVYVDTNPGSNSTLVTHGANLTQFGVQVRDQSHAEGFRNSYYNSDLDAVEFSISRAALLAAGWNGNADDLNYQVFSTKDGACNSCGTGGTPGAGDIGGRNDVHDSIYDDDRAEDYWQNQPSIKNYLDGAFNRATFAGRSKVAVVAHGNQAIQPGSAVQDLINNGAGAGYHRMIDAHDVFRQPVNLHITPTLASAIQWAKVEPTNNTPWRDGPSFNSRIATLVATNVVDLLVSTFSDHAMPYFTQQYNSDNVALAKEFLGRIYGATFTTNSVFWSPERVLDADVFSKILGLGHNLTLVDQDTHLFTWLGRTTSLGNGGYQLNRINGVKCFALNNDASTYRFQNNDGGLNMPLRSLFNRKARNGGQDQVVTLFGNWEDFGSMTQANAYDRNLRWIANHPWVKVVSLEEVAASQVDLGGDGFGDGFFVNDRGNAATNKLSHNYIQHAAQGNYDNWYVGLNNHEGLQGKVFNIRPGTPVATNYGMMFFPGVVTTAWDQVLATADTNLSKMGRAVFHASTFETAFHNEDNNDLTRFSIGTYVYPDTTFDSLASFSKNAQAQTRMAEILERVDDWLAAAAGITNAQTAAEDVDGDGETEYLVFNDRLFAVLQRTGGRMIGCWVRDILQPSAAFQALGNFVSFAGSETEEEGNENSFTNGAVNAYRTSGLKDWYALDGNSNRYVNMPYAFADMTNGWQATSSNGLVRKTVTLAPKSWNFDVQYQTFGALSNAALYIRHGLSPNLWDLLVNGQTTLGALGNSGGKLTLENTNYVTSVSATIGYADAGHTAGFNPAAIDDNPSAGFVTRTINMRNQAQTHQVEMVGTNSFSFSLGFRAYPSDWDGDGIPNVFEDANGLNSSNALDGAADNDLDGVNNYGEYVANTDMGNPADFFSASQVRATNAAGIRVLFPTKTQREYYIRYSGGLIPQNWVLATSNAIPGTGSIVEWLDDGTLTAPHPFAVTTRFYNIQVDLPR